MADSSPLSRFNSFNNKSVVVATSPWVAVRHPKVMYYGGIQRAAYSYCVGFAKQGWQVIPVVPADSHIPKCTNDHYWNREAICGLRQSQDLHAEDAKWIEISFAKHLAKVVTEVSPDVIMVLGASEPVLEQLVKLGRSFSSRLVVSLRDCPSDYSTRALHILESHPELHVVALTQIHRDSFEFKERVQVINEGVPVKEISFSNNPKFFRLSGDNPLVRRPERRLITQIDQVGPSKGQLVTLHLFKEAQLHKKGFDLVIAGDFGISLQSHGTSGSSEREKYLEAMHRFVETEGLNDHVSFHGALNGAEVEALYCASELVMAPHRMDHGNLWPSTANQFPEAYGRAMGIAFATGTPVLSSSKVESRRMINGVTGWQFADIDEGVRLMRRIANGDIAFDRSAVRQFAELNEDMDETVNGYLTLLNEIVESRTDHGNVAGSGI